MKGDAYYFAVVVVIVALLLIIGVSYYYDFQEGTPVTGRVASQVGNLTASVNTYVSCTWSNDALQVGFGTGLAQGVAINATGNNLSTGDGTMYNVSVDTLTNVNVNVTIRGNNLTSGSNVIEVSNVTWAGNITDNNGINMIIGNGIALTGSYDTANPLISNAAADSVVHYRFWLNVPASQIAGAYVGNYTQLCAEA